MGILNRFSEIVKANVNDLLDKAEDPSKMVDQYLRDLQESLAEVKRETAGVMAEETRCKRALDTQKEEIAKYENLARKALEKGNEGDARTFLSKKAKLDGQLPGLQSAYDAAHENAQKMRAMHDKLVDDIQTLEARRQTIKAKAAVAKTQDKVNAMTGGVDRAESAMSAFDRMEAKADAMLDRSNALQELNARPVDEAAALEAKYATDMQSAAVDDELARLKAEMGL